MSVGSPLHILAIDDDPGVRAYWERLLPKLGHHAVITENGTDGLRLVRSQPFDLVITDLSMPGLQGQEVLETIRTELPDLDVIVATGNGTLEAAVDALRGGAHDFLVKPFTVADVSRVIERQAEKRRLGAENLELRQANERLRELTMLKEKFLAITSHELKTPVTILSAITDLLAGEDTGLSEEEYQELMGQLVEVSGSLKEIVNRMHDLSQARRGFWAVDPQPTCLRELLEDVVSEMRVLAASRGVEVFLDPEGGTWQGYMGDAAKLREAVRALVRNGIQYTKDGGSVTLRLDSWQSAPEELAGPVIVVEDTGIGIEEGQKRLVFDTFYEAANTDQHHTSGSAFQGGGLGIGLTIVLEVVTAHGGRVSLESELGQGTTVSIKLPASPEAD